MDAIRGFNNIGTPGYSDGALDDLLPVQDAWADAEAGRVPFPVDPPGGWQHDEDGFDEVLAEGPADGWALQGGQATAAWAFQGDSLALGPLTEGLAGDPQDLGLGARAVDELGVGFAASVDVNDGMELVGPDGDDGLAAISLPGLSSLSLYALDGTDPAPATDVAFAPIAWEDLAFEVFDGVDGDADGAVDLAALAGGHFSALDGVGVSVGDGADFGGLGADRLRDDVVGSPLPAFAFDSQLLSLDDVEPHQGVPEDGFFADGLDPWIG